MAGELSVNYGQNFTIYFIVRNANAQPWNTNTSAFEAYTAGNYADYVVVYAAGIYYALCR